MAIRYEPTSLATRELDSVSVGQYTTKRAFNAQLAILDERGIPRPYLAETLPQLNSESWHVFPDGRMETTYHLRSGIAWHDGEPFSAENFAFAWRVYSAPELGQAASSPLNRM